MATMKAIRHTATTTAFLLAALAGADAAVAQATDDPAPAPQRVNLQPRFAAGQTARYEIWSQRKRVITLAVQGESRSSTTHFQTSGEVTWAVEQVNADGSAVCAMTLDWVRMSVRIDDQQEVVCDTRRASGDDDDLYTYLAAMAGAPLRVTMRADGKVTSVEGVDAIQRRAGDEVPMPDELDFMETASDLAAIAAAGRDLALEDDWESRAVWNNDVRILGLGEVKAKMQHDTTQTVASIEQIAGIGVVTVNGQSKLALEIDRGSIPADGPSVDVTLRKGDAGSQVMFDLSRGEAVGRNASQHTVIDATISFRGRSMTQTIDDTSQSQALRIEER